ncbi:C6 zinc finger domain-containing protein [Fusarium denticulatum]|uniref:C6 zinc finger domain-containing protein n=1 Tax=Fusarium denticulatum TaxID=48507 RepID=A0A8H5X1E8_9HYPO|nr:C6 zinc finger domain-containing protein [Fusarium denticulatum]
MDRTTSQQQPQSPPQSGPAPSQPHRRRRPALSCHECRRRKIKCDQRSRCAHCIRHNVKCIYQPCRDGSPAVSRARASAQASIAASPPTLDTVTEARRPARSTIEVSRNDNALTPHDQDAAPPHSATTTIAAGQGFPTPASSIPRHGNDCPANKSQGQRQGQRQGHDDNVQDLLHKMMQRLEDVAKHQSQAQGNSTRAPSPPSEIGSDNHQDKPAQGQDWQAILNKSRDMGRGSWAETTRELDSIIACWAEIMGKSNSNHEFQEPGVAAVVAQAGDFLAKCKTIAKNMKLTRPTRGLLSCPDAFVPPSRETCDVMVDLYFKSFESSHRILHAPSFLAEYKRYWDHPESITDSLRLTVLLVIAIGSSLFEYATPDDALRNAELVHHWIYASETWLAGPLEKDRVDLAGLQIYCLTLLARQIFSIGGDTVWMSTGSLIHRAMQIGLHRDPGNLDKSMPLLQAEIRRRLWVTILELVVQASLDSRMPPRISFDEFDTQPPSNLNDDEMDDSTTFNPSHPPGYFTSTTVQLALLGSLSVRLRIINVLNKADDETAYQDILALSSELTNALHMNSSLMKPGQGSTAFHRNLLDYLTRRFIIPLHFFFGNRARTNPIYYYSLKLSLDASLALMSPEPDGGFSRLMVRGGGMFREGIRVASIAAGLELLIHVQAQRDDGTLHRTSQYRQLLKQSIRDMIALAEERIRQGETNVKGPMFLSMILGQAEAIETESSIPLQIAQSARDSLEPSYNVLKMRADKAPSASTSYVDLPVGGTDLGGQASSDYVMDLNWESFLPDETFLMG